METGSRGRDSAAVSLDFEAWMDLSSRLLHLDMDARIEILDQRDVTFDDWRAPSARWAALACDVPAVSTYGAHTLSSTLTLLSYLLATARSGVPSPSRSAATTAVGPAPTPWMTGAAKVPLRWLNPGVA